MWNSLNFTDYKNSNILPLSLVQHYSTIFSSRVNFTVHTQYSLLRAKCPSTQQKHVPPVSADTVGGSN